MIQAVNNFTFIVRDSEQHESNGLIIPQQGVEKPHTGKIFSVGELVSDKKIEAGKLAIFHKGNGFTIEYGGEEYLIIEGERIIGIDDWSEQ